MKEKDCLWSSVGGYLMYALLRMGILEQIRGCGSSPVTRSACL